MTLEIQNLIYLIHKAPLKEKGKNEIAFTTVYCTRFTGRWKPWAPNGRPEFDSGRKNYIRDRKASQATAETRHYNLHVLGISDSRSTGLGRHKTNTGETVLYSGRDDQHHEGNSHYPQEGSWEVPDGVEADQVRLKGRHIINTTIIQCYAPTKDGDEDSKDTFTNCFKQNCRTTWRDEDCDERSQCKSWKWQKLR